jgi:hypothetical protein
MGSLQSHLESDGNNSDSLFRISEATKVLCPPISCNSETTAVIVGGCYHF